MLIKNKIIQSIVFTFSVLSILTAKSVNQQNIEFSHLTLEDGLSQSMVLTILQDSRGFMWFGTEDGLNRYDGYEFKIYRNNPDDQNSLSNNYIQTLFEDQDGFIWIGTYGGGLVRFDPKIDQFKHYKNEPNNSNSLSHNNVKAITQDRDGFIWIGTYGGGLNRLDPSNNHFIHYIHVENEPNSLSHDNVFELLYDSNGDLWVGTINGGLNKFNVETRVFTHYLYKKDNLSSISSNSITSIIEDRDGAIWIATLDGGINRLISVNNTITNQSSVSFKRYLADLKNNNSFVWDLYQDNMNNIWIGTTDGIIKMDIENEDFIRYKTDHNNPNSISDSEIYSIYQDRSEVLWFGTATNGLDLLLPVRKHFGLIQNVPDDDNSLNSNTIWSIYEDDNDYIWIGTGSGGLNLINKLTGQIRYFINDPRNENSLSDNRINSIFKDSKSNIWIGSEFGLNKLEFQDDLFNNTNRANRSDLFSINFIRYKNSPLDPRSISGNNIMDIIEDKHNKLWIGTYNGLNYMDPITGEFDRYINNTNDPNSISSNVISDLYIDHNNTLWVGTWYSGLNKLSINKDADGASRFHFIRYRHDPDNLKSISSDFVTHILEDHQENLWIGTSAGLNKFDKEQETFTRYSTKDGLPSNVINGLLEDGDGYIWISTNSGLSKFDSDNEKFCNYNKTDGLQDNEFNKSACFKNKNGKLYFGGIKGINSFYPENISDNPYIPPIAITDFKILNESVSINDTNSILNQSISETQDLELSYKDKIISFEFASLNFVHPYENKYAYMMEGFDSDWIYSDNRRFVTYTNLDPGDYTFKVKGSNDDNVWNEEGTSIQITIVPPFWKTTWFRLLVIAIIVGTGTYLYKQRINKIESTKRELQIRVKEKTKAASDLQKALNKVEELKRELNAENIYLQEEIKAVHNFENIITQDSKLKSILGSVEKVSSTDSTVLILGESGTGKELIARAIHNISDRKNKPLVKVNCAALPTSLVESELFGHEKGAFTGAISKKIGRFELAHKGTIFLDEIGDLDLEVQAKLLRVLQEGEFERLGSNYTQKVDVRLITATNRDLEKSINNNTFRSDLYFRLNVFPIKIPPLRERKNDIPLLTNHFVDIYGKKIGKKIDTISQNIMDTLTSYSWPGNIRELENIIERAVIISPSDKLVLGDWFSNNQNNNENTLITLEDSEKACIKNALDATGWRISGEKGAAKILGLKPTTLEYRIKKLGIKKES